MAVLPLLLENCKVPTNLRDKIYADFRNPTNYKQQLARIIVQVTTLPGASATQIRPLFMTHAERNSALGITQVERKAHKSVEWTRNVKLDELQRLPNQESISSYLRQLDTHALSSLLDDTIERLSLVHDYKQFDACRNLLAAIKLAPLSRNNEMDRLRIFKRVQAYVVSTERPLIGIQYFYDALLNSLDDLTIKEYALKSGIVDYCVSDLENATSFEDAKVRAKVIALFANKLTKSQKLQVVSAIVKQNQVLESFGAQNALKSVIQTILNDIPKEHVRTLREHAFLER